MNVKGIAVLVMLFGIVGVVQAPQAFAATKTWTGGGSDGNWSTAANWSPSGAPANGDDLIFDTGAMDVRVPHNDISSLEISGIQINGSTTAVRAIYFDTATVISGDIVNTTDTNISLNGGITLGADIEVKNIASFSTSAASGASNQILLNSFVFTLSDYSGAQGVNVPITGSGGVRFIDRVGLQLGGINTYSGTTYIEGSYVFNTTTPSASRHASQMFGSSAITIDGISTVKLDFSDANTSYANTITLAETEMNGSTFNAQLDLQNAAVGGSALSVALSGLILNGSGGIGIDSSTIGQVNLAGTAANGNCLYVSTVHQDRFVNAPSFCGGDVLSVPAGGNGDAAFIPGTPNSGHEASGLSRFMPFALGGAALCAGVGLVHRFKYKMARH